MTGEKLQIPAPVSGGIFLSYKCNSACQHCLYNCSPRWDADWISEADATRYLQQLAQSMPPSHRRSRQVSLNYGVHFTGGEPFLNYPLLLRLVGIAYDLGLSATFVETNCFWCRDDDTTRQRLAALKEAGLAGMLISANPFVVESVPFARIERAARIGREIFGENAIVYQRLFFDLFRAMSLQGTLPFHDFLMRASTSLYRMELLPMGRVSYTLHYLYRKYPASHFATQSCERELVRDWHIHMDNYGNYIPGYCGGISLGDARDLDALCAGIDLEERPVLRALLTGVDALLQLGKAYGYEEQEEYASKCHLCLDVRRHLVRVADFPELRPVEFYTRLTDRRTLGEEA